MLHLACLVRLKQTLIALLVWLIWISVTAAHRTLMHTKRSEVSIRFQMNYGAVWLNFGCNMDQRYLNRPKTGRDVTRCDPKGQNAQASLVLPQCCTFADTGIRECVSNSNTEEKTFLNKVIIFVSFVHKKYSHSFIKLQLNHWCHMDYFNNVLTKFLCLKRGSCVAVYGRSESSQITSKISSFVFRRWTKVLWVCNDMRVIN